MGHGCIQMAGSAGGQLDHRDTLGPDPVGIAFGLDVPFDHPDFNAAAQLFDGMLQEGCLPRARTADQIDGHGAHVLEVLTVEFGQGIVGGQQAGMDVNRLRPGVAVMAMVMFCRDMTPAGIAHIVSLSFCSWFIC